jgi:hypothetical protein
MCPCFMATHKLFDKILVHNDYMKTNNTYYQRLQTCLLTETPSIALILNKMSGDTRNSVVGWEGASVELDETLIS